MISVIVPIYNTEKYLRECIDSILSQTHSDFEVLLVDDGSIDKSAEICDWYAKKDSRIRVFLKDNGGVSSARNLGLRNARGEWVCFIDSDDTVTENYLEVLLKTAVVNDSDSSMGGFQQVDAETFTVIPTRIDGRETVEDNIKDFYACTQPNWQRYLWNRLFKMEVIISNNLYFNEKIHSKEDGLFVIQFLCCSNGYVGCNPRIIYNYRQHTKSLSAQARECVFSHKLLTNPIGHNLIVKTLRNNGYSKEVLRLACSQAKSTTEWVRNIMYRSGNKKLRYNLLLEWWLCDTLGMFDYWNYRSGLVKSKIKYEISRFLQTVIRSVVFIRPNRVLLVSRDGNQWSCNPKAIAEYLSQAGEWDVCVGINNTNKREYDNKNIKFVNIGSLRYYCFLASAHFFISNERVSQSTTYPFKPKGQIYIQTTHGGPGIKKLPYTDKEGIEPCWEYTHSCQDYILSNGNQKDEVIKKGYHFTQPILHIGLPRNDIFFASDEEKHVIKESVLRKLNLPVNCNDIHIVVIAPTFRYFSTPVDWYPLNHEGIKASFSKRFGGKWIIVAHKHSAIQLSYHKKYLAAADDIIDGSCIEDIQDLLICADALITDYSSVEMDFCLTGKPQFQYFPDGKNWEKLTTRNPQTLPFPYAETNEQLCYNIEHFDEKKYKEELLLFKKNVIQIIDDGKACERLEKWMTEKCNPK